MKTKSKLRATLGAICTVGMLLSTSSISAHPDTDTLTEALISAYQTSPTLKLNQAALRAADEGVAQASAARRPQLNASINAAINDSTNAPRDYTDTYRAQLDASLLLFDGGLTEAAIQSAKANVLSVRSSLGQLEQRVLLDAITAYVDVRRDARFVSLAENNVLVIGQQVDAARDRFDVGEVTRTDVSQADARLASARSNLASNRGAFERSQQFFVVAVGKQPNHLAPPPALPKLPATLEQAQAIAMNEHPAIRSDQHAVRSAEFDVIRARAAKRPTVSLGANVTYGVNTPTFNDEQLSGQISLNGQMPILDGGRNNSLIRQAMAILDQRKAELQDGARTVERDTANAWSNLEVARASIRSSRQQIRAARVAFDGIQEEAKLGARTTLDVLDAEQEVLNAEFGLVSAQRDEYVAAYTLVAAMGLLTTEYLNLDVERYDPDLNFRAVNSKPLTKEGAALQKIGSRWGN